MIKQHTTKLALLAGTAALAALVPQAHAQSSDALIDKLVDKGILTANEAKDLREEADKDFRTAFQSKTGMPDWVTGYKISGDFRGRYDKIMSDNNAMIDRDRYRYRLRLGLTISMLDNLEAGLRLGSGDANSTTGNPLSNNSTLQDNFSKKMLYLDAAYGKWTALTSGGWLLAVTAGKMDNPFQFTPMVFDPDLTPEGAALSGSYDFNDKHSIAFAGAGFVLDEEGKFGALPGATSASSTHDPFIYGGQVMWNAKWTEKLASSLGVGAFQVVSPEQLTTISSDGKTGSVTANNQGNTRYSYTPSGGSLSVVGLKYDYTPIIGDASVTYTLDSFPFYNGAFPIKFAGEAMYNSGAPDNNKAFWVGATLGKSGHKKTWDLSYRYEYIEADAWYDQLVDDDNGAFYTPNTTGPAQDNNKANYANGTASAGWFGGTNVKGHLVKLNYSFTDSFTFSVSSYINDLIIPSTPGAGVEPTTSSIRFFADLMWKF